MIVIPADFKFHLHELVDKHTYRTRGEAAWGVFTQRAIDALHGLRLFIDRPITINNWFAGGPYAWSGYRSPECTIGAAKSEHRSGNAFDCKIQGTDAESVRIAILANQDDPRLRNIMRLEADVSWLHFDCAALPAHQSRIYVFKG